MATNKKDRQNQICKNPSCGHNRTQHSRNGCTWPGCGCKSTYMEVGKENR